MNKFLFLVSHLGSGSDNFLNILNSNPRLDIKNIGATYSHIEDFYSLRELGHKLNNVAAVYGDHLLHNTTFYFNSGGSFCKFIYFIRNAEPALNIILTHGFDEKTAYAYYLFRLRRLYEMTRKNPGLLITWQELADKTCLPAIKKYLNLNELDYSGELPTEYKKKVSWELITKAQDIYEKYYFHMNLICDHVK